VHEIAVSLVACAVFVIVVVLVKRVAKAPISR
jgi:hypothetical protein